MKPSEAVLQVLGKTDDFVSGKELAEGLNVSRNAVWKHIKQLEGEGYIIESHKTRGYRLSYENSRLCGAQIQKFAGDTEVILLDEVDSTNNYAKILAEGGQGENTLVIARKQTGGKGRMGRTFISPEGGLYMSLILRPDISPDKALQITVAAAVAVARALEAVCGVSTQIKWVNDIYKGGKKVCGILTEGAICAETGKLQYAVLGVGINVAKVRDSFDKEIRKIAGSVYEDERVPSEIYAKIINEFLFVFFKYYANLAAREYIEYFKNHSFLDGKRIEYIAAGVSHKAKVVGIDGNAGLVIEEKGEIKTLASGEVSVKKWI